MCAGRCALDIHSGIEQDDRNSGQTDRGSRIMGCLETALKVRIPFA